MKQKFDRDFFAAQGAKGGAAGKGKSKARTPGQARKAALARWAKAKRKVKP